MEKPDQPTHLHVRARTAIEIYYRLLDILTVYATVIFVERADPPFLPDLDDTYISLRQQFEDLLKADDMQEIRDKLPHPLPESTYVFTGRKQAKAVRDVLPGLTMFKGTLRDFGLRVGAQYIPDSTVAALFAPYDLYIEGFEQIVDDERVERKKREQRAQVEEPEPPTDRPPQQGEGETYPPEPRGAKIDVPERVVKVHKLLKGGEKRATAFKQARIDSRTYYQWCEEVTGEPPIMPHDRDR